MALENVTKLGIVVLKEKKNELIKLLNSFEHVQLIKRQTENSGDEKLENLTGNITEFKTAIALLQEYGEKKGIKDLLKPKKEFTLSELEKTATDEKHNLVKKLNEYKENIKERENQNASIRLDIEKYKRWEFSQIKLNSGDLLDYTDVYFISGKKDSFDELEEKLRIDDLSYELQLSISEREVNGVIFYMKKDKDVVFKSISDSSLNITEFEVEDSASEILTRLNNEFNENNKEIVKIQQEIIKQTSYEEELEVILDYLTISKNQAEAESCFEYTDYTAYLNVYVPKSLVLDFKKFLSSKIKEVEIMELPLETEEKAPVVFRGNGFTAPFQTISTMYGTPGKGEFDPTPLFAPFFVLFFGFCLSDAGYGLVVLILALMGLSFKEIDRDIKKGLVLMTYCGISTMIIGALAGGWFGLPLDNMEGVIAKKLLSFKIIDPNRDALLVMGISLLLGTIQILWSMLIAAYKHFTNGDIKSGIESILWFVYLAVFFPCVVKYAGYVPDTFPGQAMFYPMFGYMILALIAFYVITGNSHILVRPLMGVLKIYDTVGYFGDVLSYSRLMALGLATGGVALAINTIGDLAREMIPGVGILAQIAILIIGHGFNIIINVLGSFIHSMRLQFVEFFQKFFEGGGILFTPFKIVTSKVRIIKN